MTAMDELRLLLDERGAEWEAFDDFEQTTQWSTYNGAFVYWARERDGKLLVETTAPTKCSASCTPEQAVEVTLGPSDPREHGLIPHFWTGDETLHIDLGKLPERIDVTLPDPRGREVYSARVHRFEPERGECRNKHAEFGTFRCSACGYQVLAISEGRTGSEMPPNFCPHCGRKVIDA